MHHIAYIYFFPKDEASFCVMSGLQNNVLMWCEHSLVVWVAGRTYCGNRVVGNLLNDWAIVTVTATSICLLVPDL